MRGLRHKSQVSNVTRLEELDYPVFELGEDHLLKAHALGLTQTLQILRLINALQSRHFVDQLVDLAPLVHQLAFQTLYVLNQLLVLPASLFIAFLSFAQLAPQFCHLLLQVGDFHGQLLLLILLLRVNLLNLR